jgi:transmembrane protein 17
MQRWRPQYWRGLRYRDDDVVRTVLMSFWLLAEPLRLAAGRYGNLHENVRGN